MLWNKEGGEECRKEQGKEEIMGSVVEEPREVSAME